MSTLLALVLAAAELTPPPAVEAPPPAPVEQAVKAPDDLAAQLSFGALATVNGVWIGLNTCGLFSCFNGGGATAGIPLSGAAGAFAGVALTAFVWDVAGDWGGAGLLDSGMAGATIGSFWLASRPFMPSVEVRYLTAAGLDVLGTAAVVLVARSVKPRPEQVWLADSLVLWGVVIGNLLPWLVRPPDGDPSNLVFAGAAAGGLAGAMLAATAPRMTAVRFWVANAGAVLGGLLLGGGLLLAETLFAGNAFNPVVPASGAMAGIAAGFLVGFTFSESW